MLVLTGDSKLALYNHIVIILYTVDYRSTACWHFHCNTWTCGLFICCIWILPPALIYLCWCNLMLQLLHHLLRIRLLLLTLIIAVRGFSCDTDGRVCNCSSETCQKYAMLSSKHCRWGKSSAKNWSVQLILVWFILIFSSKNLGCDRARQRAILEAWFIALCTLPGTGSPGPYPGAWPGVEAPEWGSGDWALIRMAWPGSVSILLWVHYHRSL